MARFPGVSGVILAGGLATRMGGGEKALLLLHGRTLLDRVAAALSGLFEELVVVTPRPDLLAGAAGGLPLVEDIHAGAGPLGGVHAAMAAVSHPRLFVAACDLPFLDTESVAVVVERSGEAEMVVPRIGGRLHCLHGSYAAGLRGEADRLLRDGERKVRSMAGACSALYLEAADFAAAPGIERSLFNINTPEDLAEAERILREREG